MERKEEAQEGRSCELQEEWNELGQSGGPNNGPTFISGTRKKNSWKNYLIQGFWSPHYTNDTSKIY